MTKVWYCLTNLGRRARRKPDLNTRNSFTISRLHKRVFERVQDIRSEPFEPGPTMRITYKPVKRVTPAVGTSWSIFFHILLWYSQHPQIQSLITSLLESPIEQLAEVFESVQTWRYPRSDLHSWIAVLNRLDEIYENIIHEYDLSKLQNKPFSTPSKRLLLGLLRFQRMLLDNSTNRKLFNSYDVSAFKS
jgi:hypothetical protein